MFTLPLPPYLIAGGDATWGGNCTCLETNAPCALLLVIETFLFFWRHALKDHNIISRQEGTCAKRKATERGGGAFLQTLPVKMTDYLGGRTVKSQFGTRAPPSPVPHPTAAFKCRPTNLQASLPLGCSKCIIIKIPPVAGLHCNFQVACAEAPQPPRNTRCCVPSPPLGFHIKLLWSLCKDERI